MPKSKGPLPKARKIIFGKLEVRPLSVSDVAAIIIFAIAVYINLMLCAYCPSKRVLSTVMVAFATGFITITTPFGMRFKNIYFSIIWLLLCVAFIKIASVLTYAPLCIFLFYHVLRILFWKQYDKEFIPYYVNRGGWTPYYSKREKRSGKTYEDKRYTMYMFIIGLLIIFGSVLLQGRNKADFKDDGSIDLCE